MTSRFIENRPVPKNPQTSLKGMIFPVVADVTLGHDRADPAVLFVRRDNDHPSVTAGSVRLSDPAASTGATLVNSMHGGTDFNPVGTVYIGIAGPAEIEVKRIRHGGDRQRIRALATQSALDQLRKVLLKGE